MKRNLLIFWAVLTGVIFLSGCYTKFTEPIVRQEIYEQAESDTVILDDQSFENYSFDTSNLNDYNTGYRDAYRDFLHSNLWYGYSQNPRMYSSYRYGYYPNNSYFLGYYDPWSYDPFYDWDYYRYYSYYGGYYGGYYDPYYYGWGWGGGGGYHSHHNYWYNNGGGSGETIAEGRDQKKAEWQAKETTVSRSRTSDTGGNSDFQTTISYMPSTFQASNTTSASGTKTVTTITGTGSQKARMTIKSASSGTTSNGEPVVGFQTTLVPAATQTTVTRQSTGSRTGTKTTYIKSSGSSRSSGGKKSSSKSKPSSSDNSSSTPSSSSSSSGSSSTPSSSTGSSTSSSGSSTSSSSSSGRSSSSSSSGSSRSSSSKASSDSSKNHK